MISIQNLSFQYRKNKPLFNNLELELKPGNIYGLLGKNGAGKTTLLKIISGMLYADKGKCTLNGKRTDKRLPKTYDDIFFIPEEFELPAITIDQFVETHSAFYSKFDFALFHKSLSEFGLNSFEKINSLSFGQKKMVIISFGIAANTKYLVLDEPSNALDIPSKAILRKLLAGAINDERSFIISTHQIRDLDNLIDPIIILDSGKIIFNFSCDKIGEQLSFIPADEVVNEKVLFTEENIGGNKCICTNSKGEFSKLNLELLFNGVTQQPEAINQVLTLKN